MTKRPNQSPVVSALADVLADTYTLAVKTHTYHWNVEGPQFVGLHELFSNQYEALYDAADELAERIRALGDKAPGGMKVFAGMSAVKDDTSATTAKDMIKDLQKSHQTVADRAAKALNVAEKHDDAASADILTERLQTHQKEAWMLGALLK